MTMQIEPPGYHRVVPGETVVDIASSYGFLDPNTVWNEGKNATLRKDRDIHIIYPGDRIWIPAPPAGSSASASGQSGPSIKVQAGGSTPIQANTDQLTLALQDNTHAPCKGVPFHMEIGTVQVGAGTTPADGKIKVGLSAKKGSAILTADGMRIRLRIGELSALDDPSEVKKVAAIQARLNNLGLRAGAEDGVLGDRTARAISVFQKLEGLKVDGEVSQALIDKLKQLHGG